MNERKKEIDKRITENEDHFKYHPNVLSERIKRLKKLGLEIDNEVVKKYEISRKR